ncbi:MAG: cell division protein FtsA [Helicobacteraceae bacterium]|jgi:cell division protein FtsA|nr:cell division protein FtsA [Helicobacteraceae bacterium]
MSSPYILAIDVGSHKICALVAQIGSDRTARVIGTGLARSQGLKKGAIVDITKASEAIKAVANDACQSAGIALQKAVVSVSGAYAASLQSVGKANIPTKEIEPKDVNRVMRLALDSAAMPPPDHEILHVLPFSFKVDDQPNVQDPVGMSGSRLEVQVNIVITQKMALDNLRKAIAAAGIEIENLALSSYAASIAVLGEDEKELGACVIDMGASTCNLAIYQGAAPRHCDFFAVGGGHITSDLSISLHTPINAAERIKIEYGSLKRREGATIEIPEIGVESATRAASLETISNVIGARMEETLLILSGLLGKSRLKNGAGAGVVITGGASKLDGVSEIAPPIFGNIPVRIARPKPLSGLTETFRDPAFAVVIGLVRYGAGEFTPYEIDSTNVLRIKSAARKPPPEETAPPPLTEDSTIIGFPKEGEPNALKRFWNWLSQIF